MGKYENAFCFLFPKPPFLSGSWQRTPFVQIWVELTIGGHGEVTWGQMTSQSVFKSRQDGDRYAQMMPNDLAPRAASEDVHIDLLGS